MPKENKNQETHKEKPEDEVSVFIEGENVDLVPRNKKHIPLYNKWVNDPEVRKYLRKEIPTTVAEMEKRSERVEEGMKQYISFEVWHKKDKKPIGVGGFSRINWINRNANIYLNIGEKEYWGKNLATEITKLMLRYAFEELNFHKVYSGVFTPNIASWSVAEKIGFKHEGTLKHEVYVDGKYYDAKKYGLLKREWNELNQR
ncbi:MAG: N-acetyltransferase [Promethearchaeota archaeon]|nr:MAG: N-acetyltransferase [Candidatus Lokiarchaeota archaeon]